MNKPTITFVFLSLIPIIAVTIRLVYTNYLFKKAARERVIPKKPFTSRAMKK